MVAILLVIATLIVIIMLLLWVIYSLKFRNNRVLKLIVIFIYMGFIGLYYRIRSNFRENVSEQGIFLPELITIIFLVIFMVIFFELYL